MTYKTLNTSTHMDLAFTHLIVTQQKKMKEMGKKKSFNCPRFSSLFLTQIFHVDSEELE